MLSDGAEILRLAPAKVRQRNRPVIDRLQAALRSAIREAVPDTAQGYALLDFPNHANVGDNAIYLGELALTREHFAQEPLLVGEAERAVMDRLRKLPRAAPLLLHGGGNFGDLYPKHQTFRVEMLERFQDRPIVILPQSIHFQDHANIRAAADAIAAHKNVTLMVRDRISERFARQHFSCRTLLVPDMAFMIGEIVAPAGPDTDLVALLREDKERAIADDLPLSDRPGELRVFDWPSEDRRPGITGRLPRTVRAMLPSAWQGWRPETPPAFERLARMRVDRGVAMLARGRMVLTDRLHAHILSLLLGRPHLVLDNSYGKIARFADAWTRDAAFAGAHSLQEALDTVSEARQ